MQKTDNNGISDDRHLAWDNSRFSVSGPVKAFLLLVFIIISFGYIALFYSSFVEPTGFRWRALFGDENYPEGYETHGIDISHYQRNVDWGKLRHATVAGNPLKFVMVKATEGDSHVDEKFFDYFRKSRENAFIRGVYHFWSNKSSAASQAYFFLNTVKLVPGDLPPILDVETKSDDISDQEFQNEVLTWLRIVEANYHVKPIIYTNYKFKETYLSDKRFDDYPYWIAHYYVKRVDKGVKWKFWQHTDAGRLPGIEGFVDLDIYNGSYYNLTKLTIPEEEEDTTDTMMSSYPVSEYTE
ncbi:MAG: glycoside hydrolase family 25 protein [Prevotella sp.]|nr:glycoside hydrolase family 25 protein [Prevotella sp.]